MLGLTFWIGVMSLAGLVFVIAPFPISPSFISRSTGSGR